MTQTRKHSLIEAVTNTSVAFVISFSIASVVYPLYFPDVTYTQTFTLTVIFTVISIGRG